MSSVSIDVSELISIPRRKVLCFLWGFVIFFARHLIVMRALNSLQLGFSVREYYACVGVLCSAPVSGGQTKKRFEV